ncbi:hypothetical protein BGLA2_1880008 [Burkholderia gladioli]|nr:hypothetical protein BGLA2_1880008 [Burkholderia gladioli]
MHGDWCARGNGVSPPRGFRVASFAPSMGSVRRAAGTGDRAGAARPPSTHHGVPSCPNVSTPRANPPRCSTS